MANEDKLNAEETEILRSLLSKAVRGIDPKALQSNADPTKAGGVAELQRAAAGVDVTICNSKCL